MTLHVGAGTFLPVKDPGAHQMHAERGEVTEAAAAAVEAAREGGGRVIPVGTTALRVLETAAARGGRRAVAGRPPTLFIAPGHEFRATDALLTNFHLPRSTLLMLVSALMGRRAHPPPLRPRRGGALPVLLLRRRVAADPLSRAPSGHAGRSRRNWPGAVALGPSGGGERR